MQTIDLLLQIAENGAMYEKARITTIFLSKKLNYSQQTVSNELRRLEIEGLIEREPINLGINVKLTKKGRDLLVYYQDRLSDIHKKIGSIKGIVVSGIGEGKFYVSQKKYKAEFTKKLGIDPYPGTLNLMINEAEKNRLLDLKKPVLIKGFATGSRTFGDIVCYNVLINQIRSAIIIPKRTHHDNNIIEVISKEFLRDKLNLKDGSEVEISET